VTISRSDPIKIKQNKYIIFTIEFIAIIGSFIEHLAQVLIRQLIIII